MPEAACAFCFTRFSYARQRGPHAQRFCSPKCRERAQNRRQWERQRKPCPRCGGRLDSGAHSGEACLACRVEAQRQIFKQVEALWHEGHTYKGIASVLGVTVGQAGHLITLARRAGFDLARRYTPPVQTPREARSVGKNFRRQEPPDETLVTRDGRRLQLRDKQKTIIRLLLAAPDPLSARQLADFVQRLSPSVGGCGWQGIYTSLGYLRKRGLVQSVRRERGNHYHARVLWVVPATSDSLVLTLDDALREKELAALIAEQTADKSRGHFAETDYKAAFSLDANRFSEDGGSWHDVLEDVA